MNLDHEVTARGGLAPTHQLLAAGATSHSLTAAVRSGEIVRLRQGWYALPDTELRAGQAVRVGGRLSCVSGARVHGLWVSPTARLHVRVGCHDSRLRTKDDHHQRLGEKPDHTVRVHWGAQGAPGTRFTMLPRECLRDMVLCQSPERVVAAADSAIRAGYLSRAQWRRDIHALPARLRAVLELVDANSESILESIMRFRLVQLGYVPLVQARIPGVGRVDLLLGHLVIELDGWEFHKSREQFEEDRRRDALLASRGYRVLRFTYRQLTRRWHEVLAAVAACTA